MYNLSVSGLPSQSSTYGFWRQGKGDNRKLLSVCKYLVPAQQWDVYAPCDSDC